MNTIFYPKLNLFICGLILIANLTSCKKETQDYTIPTTYNFSNVNYSGQTIRIAMLDAISAYMNTGNTGAVLNSTTLKNMYSNSGNPFSNTVLDTSGKQLKNKTYAADQAYFEGLFDSLALASQSGGGTASDGIAGIEGGRLFDKHGIELSQVIKKQLMGAVFYYQALETYLNNLQLDDNTTIVPEEGTAQQHHADEAFGYLGVPVNFPSNVVDAKYWGAYCVEVNPAISSSKPIMDAFLKLRAAITNKDNTTRDAQVVIIKTQWERIVAASAILELTEAKTAYSNNDFVEMRHVLSEGVGFINSLKYSSDKKITNAQINSALSALGTNFYTISNSQIDNAINSINAVYGFNLSAF